MIEVRIPISPRPAWFNRVRLIAASIREFYPDAIIRVTIGDDRDADDIWRTLPRGIPGVKWHVVARTMFNAWAGTRAEYLETIIERYRAPFDGDHILMLDADVICLRRFDELFPHNSVQGVQAHVPPATQAGWTRLFHDCGLRSQTFPHEYSGWGIMCVDHQNRTGPFYPNSGVVFGPRRLFERLAGAHEDMVETMSGLLADAYWFDQLAIALGVAAAAVPVRSLPLRYNFPNQAAFDHANPGELAQAAFIHYLRTDVIDRDRDFEDYSAIRRLVARTDLTGSNEAVRKRVEELLPVAFPEPAPLDRVEDAPWA